MVSFVIIIPTHNGINAGLEKLLISIKSQSVQPEKIYIIDSSSTDNTVELCKSYGCIVDIIDKSEFNHGLTRQKGIENNSGYDVSVFMTQDILLKDNNTLKTLLLSFENREISATYGRQITYDNASLIEKISRAFNYPELSQLKSKDDIKNLGLHTAFCSDSFAAYRIKDVIKAGGFPTTNFAEDMLLCAKFILEGKKVYYNAESVVYHSHIYSIKSEYMRGKEIGKMHRANKWLLKEFGSAETRGKVLLKSLPFHKKLLYILQSLPKLIGYKLSK